MDCVHAFAEALRRTGSRREGSPIYTKGRIAPEAGEEVFIELIRRNNLDESFADRLPQIVRGAYLQCFDQMQDQLRYERERGGH